MAKVHVIDHPLVQHKLTIIRDKDTGTKAFRELVNEVATLMAYEITRDVELEDTFVETPLQRTPAKTIAGKKIRRCSDSPRWTWHGRRHSNAYPRCKSRACGTLP